MRTHENVIAHSLMQSCALMNRHAHQEMHTPTAVVVKAVMHTT